MKKLAFVLAVLLILLCSCRFIPGPRETETGTESVATESETETETEPETEQATETETEPATEPADTAPAITPDPEGDVAAYAKISAKAENDVRFLLFGNTTLYHPTPEYPAKDPQDTESYQFTFSLFPFLIVSISIVGSS